MYVSPLLHVFTYDPETGALGMNPAQRLEPKPRFGALGVYVSNVWKLRYRGAYIPAAEVAWMHCYQVIPKGRLHLLNRLPHDVRQCNLVTGELPDVNALRRRLNIADMQGKPADLAQWAREEGVSLAPPARTKEQCAADREHWAKEQEHCAGLGIPCPEFKWWPSDLLHTPELDSLG